MTTTQRPFTAASFEEYLNEKKLMGSRCSNCEMNFLPPRAICPKCYRDQLEWIELDGRARLAAFTSICIAPTAMLDAGYGRDKPYIAGVVELADSVKMSAQILGLDATKPEEIEVGTPLRAEFIERGEGDDKQTFLAFRAI